MRGSQRRSPSSPRSLCKLLPYCQLGAQKEPKTQNAGEEGRCGDCDWPPGFLEPHRPALALWDRKTHAFVLPGEGYRASRARPRRAQGALTPWGCRRLRNTKAGSTSASAWPGALSRTLEAPQLSGSPDPKLVGGGI